MINESRPRQLFDASKVQLFTGAIGYCPVELDHHRLITNNALLDGLMSRFGAPKISGLCTLNE